MAGVNVIDEGGPWEILCPRCRGDANWRFLDEAKSLVEVVCCDCGSFEMPRAEFEQAQSDIAEANERN